MKFSARHAFVASLAGSLAFAACGKKEKTSRLATHLSREEGAAVLRRYDDRILIDGRLTDAEVGALGYDFRKLESLEIDAPPRAENPVQSTLVRAYGSLFGNEEASPFAYLFERVKVIVSSGTRVLPPDPSPDPLLIAQNPSVGIWIDRMLDHRNSGGRPGALPPLLVGGRSMDANSSRLGLIQFAPHYSRIDDSISRIGTLIHEARHSDCPNGISGEQLDRITAEGDALVSETFMAIVGDCGFLHPACPAGHPLAGKHACESGAGWGAYSVTLPFYRMIYAQCRNCSEAERQAALAAAADAASRVLRLDDLGEGRLGSPELRQQGYRD